MPIGRPVALYLRGHELLHSWGFGMLSSGIGLFIGIGTYHKYLSWGLTVDPLMVPDVWYLAQCFRDFVALVDGQMFILHHDLRRSMSDSEPLCGPRRSRIVC